MDFNGRKLDDLPDAMTVDEAAVVLVQCKHTILSMIHKGELQAIKVRRRYLVPKESIRRLLAGDKKGA